MMLAKSPLTSVILALLSGNFVAALRQPGTSEIEAGCWRRACAVKEEECPTGMVCAVLTSGSRD